MSRDSLFTDLLGIQGWGVVKEWAFWQEITAGNRFRVL